MIGGRPSLSGTERSESVTAPEMGYGEDHKYIPATSQRSGEGTEASDVFACTIQIVNIGLVGDPQSDTYVLIDAGMPKSVDDVHRGSRSDSAAWNCRRRSS